MKPRWINLLVLWLSLPGFFIPAAGAAVLLSDTFSYPDGPITNAPGTVWTNFSGGGAGNEMLVASSRLQIAAARSEDVSATLSGQPYATNSGVVLYASFTVNFSALPNAGTYFAQYNNSSSRCRVWATTTGAASGAFRLSVGNYTGASATSGQLTNDLVLNTNYTVVTSYDTSSGYSTIWLNPLAETNMSVTATDAPSPGSITTFAFRQNTGEGTLSVDNLIIGTTFADVVTNALAVTNPPSITSQPQSQTVLAGDTVTFTVTADGTPPLSYQWHSNNVNVVDATNTTFTLASVATNLTGSAYFVTIFNTAGTTNSLAATLTVTSAPPVVVASNLISYLHYNVKGNGATNWSTNSPQVQAIGRELTYLNPDIIAFNEIPHNYLWEMTNWVKAFLSGYNLATNSGTDNFINSVIASRFPIVRSQKWLDGAQLEPWGYTNANFTRDLFEAEIAVPGFAQHLHVFTSHLKSSISGYTDAAAKRAAEAAAITNFFATNLFALYPLHPYILSGDMNEDNINTLAIQELVSPPTGLQLTNPKNPVTGSIDTDPTTSANPDSRIDYIFPCGLLSSNIASSQVFRTDRLTPVPPNLFSNDCKIASDHLPVMMVFSNPYTRPIRVNTLNYAEPALTAQWNTVLGGIYRVETSTNLISWAALATSLTATNGSYTFTTNITGSPRFFRVRAP